MKYILIQQSIVPLNYMDMGYMKTLFLYDYEFKVDFCNTFISLSKLNNSKNCNFHTDKGVY